jgi:hypothetical protein
VRITAIFEEWYIGDGTYPPLHKHQLVNMAFEMHPQRLCPGDGEVTRFQHVGNAEYDFTGIVLRHYRDDELPVLLIEADGFRFYISNGTVPFTNYQQDQLVSGRGMLTLDHFLWAEFGNEYESDPPNLFYTLCVARITEMQIPETHITRRESGLGAPTWVPTGEVQNIRETESMEERKWEVGFYLVEYDDEGVTGQVVPRTAT